MSSIDKQSTRAENGPCIYIVATPIGNLEDLTPRALSTLRSVELIAAEDTRNTRKLLTHFNISAKELISYHDHVEGARSIALIERIERERLSLALVSDAGTPCVADPGFRLVKLAKERQIPVIPIPGASALTSLISVSGLPSDRVLFVGFLPSKDADIRREIQSWAVARASIVYFEPTRRLFDSLSLIGEMFPRSEVSVGRELTKIYEEVVTLPIGAAIEWANTHDQLKGEAVVMVSLNVDQLSEEATHIDSARDHARKVAEAGFANGKSQKDLMRELGGLGLPRTDLYQMLLEIKKNLSK